MNKCEVADYFDRCALDWDAHMVTDDAKIEFILNAAGVTKDSTVLDVACGTGVLFPYYMKSDVSHVIGVDISKEMIRISQTKFQDTRIELICGDIETIPVQAVCDCCVVYNAFPHFEDPERLVARLAQWIKDGGRLTVAHGMSLEKLRNHHRGRAQRVSREMLPPRVLADILEPWFEVDIALSDEEKYVVSGKRRGTPHACSHAGIF